MAGNFIRHPLTIMKCIVPNCPRRSETSHHKKTRGSGGKDGPENEVPICKLHHWEYGWIGPSRFEAKYNIWLGSDWAKTKIEMFGKAK